MLYLLLALSVMYILLMYYVSLLLLPPDGFVLCYIGFPVLTLWRFDDDVISPSPGKERYTTPISMRHFRPLSFCNVPIKVVSKVIFNRLKGLLKNVITTNQTSFIPGRQVTDNIVT